MGATADRLRKRSRIGAVARNGHRDSSQQELGKKFIGPFFSWPDDTKLREWLREQDPDELEQFLGWFDFINHRDRETLGRQELRKLRDPTAKSSRKGRTASEGNMRCEALLPGLGGAEIHVKGESAEEVLTVGRELAAALQKPGEPRPPVVTHIKNNVFVVHGHDEGARESVARFLEKIGLTAIILREQPNQGRTTIEKFVDCAGEVGFAVVLLTPDDLGGAAATAGQFLRARQNVIFELGYFVGSLGRGRACLLRKGEVEIPSDLYGVVYTELDHADGWKLQLAKELRACQEIIELTFERVAYGFTICL